MLSKPWDGDTSSPHPPGVRPNYHQVGDVGPAHAGHDLRKGQGEIVQKSPGPEPRSPPSDRDEHASKTPSRGIHN